MKKVHKFPFENAEMRLNANTHTHTPAHRTAEYSTLIQYVMADIVCHSKMYRVPRAIWSREKIQSFRFSNKISLSHAKQNTKLIRR